MEEKGKDFERFSIEAVDEGLKALGESGKQIIFFHLERRYPLRGMTSPQESGSLRRGTGGNIRRGRLGAPETCSGKPVL